MFANNNTPKIQRDYTQNPAAPQTLTGHSSYVNALAVLPDGTLVSGSDDHTIKLWNSTTGQCLKTLTGHRSGDWLLDISVSRWCACLSDLTGRHSRQ